jgi:hypothetical protein
MRLDLDLALFGSGDTVKVRGQDFPTTYRGEFAVAGNEATEVNVAPGRARTLVVENRGSFTIAVEQIAASDDSILSTVQVRGGGDAVIPLRDDIDQVRFTNSDSSSTRLVVIIF